MVNFQSQDDEDEEQNNQGDPLKELLAFADSVFEESDGDCDEREEAAISTSPQCQVEQAQQTLEYFLVVGSNWEMRYQDGLQKCYELRVKKENVKLRVEHEPDNISDCNALKFEVLSDGQWFIIGYCGVKKIPKLKRALHHHELVSMELCNLRRIWNAKISEFRFSADINIVKRGKWDKDDPNNRYNSSIVM